MNGGEDIKSSPLFYTHVKLFVSSLLALKPYKSYSDVYEFYGYPITKVELMGVVVGRAPKGPDRTLYTIDDGTGLITCTQWHKKDETLDQENEVQLGNLIQMWGKLQTFRQTMELSIYNLRVVDDVNEEMLAWLDLVNVTLKSYIPNAQRANS